MNPMIKLVAYRRKETWPDDYVPPERALLLHAEAIVSVVECSNCSVITMNNGDKHWTTDTVAYVYQMIELYHTAKEPEVPSSPTEKN